jgi:hypothetical protein
MVELLMSVDADVGGFPPIDITTESALIDQAAETFRVIEHDSRVEN